MKYSLAPPYKPLAIKDICDKESLSTRLWATKPILQSIWLS